MGGEVQDQLLHHSCRESFSFDNYLLAANLVSSISPAPPPPFLNISQKLPILIDSGWNDCKLNYE